MKRITAALSAYGAMTEPDRRYLAFFRAADIEEFKAKLHAFLCSEVVRAQTTPEISEQLGPFDSTKVFDSLAEFELNDEPYTRDVITIGELSTDYHIEYYDPNVCPDFQANRPGFPRAILMIDSSQEYCYKSEFPSVMQIYDAASEVDENGNPVLVDYSDDFHGTIYMTASELNSFLLCRDPVEVPVI